MSLLYPVDVRGWLSQAEAERLYSLARGRRVLEIGAYCGLSTICLAQAAVEVVTVDTFLASPDGGEDTYADFRSALRRYGVSERVVAHRGLSADVLPTLSGPFNGVFVDGDHRQASVAVDIALSLPLLAPDAWLAFHDYDGAGRGAVQDAVDVWRGLRAVELVDRLAVLWLKIAQGDKSR